MNSQEILNVFLIIGILVIIPCVIFATYYFVQALKSITQLADDLDETAQNLKNKIQMKALTAILALLISLASKIIKKRRG